MLGFYATPAATPNIDARWLGQTHLIVQSDILTQHIVLICSCVRASFVYVFTLSLEEPPEYKDVGPERNSESLDEP